MMGRDHLPADPSEEKSQRTLAREAFFLDFATEIRKRFPDLVLMVTGGIRSRAGAEAVVQSKACDLVGIGRPAAVNPKFPQLLLDESVPDEEAQLVLAKAPLPGWAKFFPLKKALGAGAESVSFPPPYCALHCIA
jgi:2,4-dienoyl-CoA reductase-like NADH-dependent reductase (Old Yellow Enzyme family)